MQPHEDGICEGFCEKLKTVEHRLAEQFMETGKLHRSVLERLLNKTGVHRSQHQILMCLSWNPDISQKKLAALYHVSTAAVAVSLKKLEKGGYIERAVDIEDNRYNKIRLTPKGCSVVENSYALFWEVEECMFAGFASEEKARFLSYLERLSDNLGRICGKKATKGETKHNETIQEVYPAVSFGIHHWSTHDADRGGRGDHAAKADVLHHQQRRGKP